MAGYSYVPRGKVDHHRETYTWSLFLSWVIKVLQGTCAHCQSWGPCQANMVDRLPSVLKSSGRTGFLLAVHQWCMSLQQIDAHCFTGKVLQPEGQGSKLRNNKRDAGQEMSRKYKLPILIWANLDYQTSEESSKLSTGLLGPCRLATASIIKQAARHQAVSFRAQTLNMQVLKRVNSYKCAIGNFATSAIIWCQILWQHPILMPVVMATNACWGFVWAHFSIYIEVSREPLFPLLRNLFAWKH